MLEAQKQLSRLQVQSLESTQSQATRIDELSSANGLLLSERDGLREALERMGKRHQGELEAIQGMHPKEFTSVFQCYRSQGNHQLETARLSIRIRDLEASEAKKAEALQEMEAKRLSAEKRHKALLALSHEK